MKRQWLASLVCSFLKTFGCQIVASFVVSVAASFVDQGFGGEICSFVLVSFSLSAMPLVTVVVHPQGLHPIDAS